MKDLKNITEEEVKFICELLNEPYISYMAGEWSFGLAVQINTTSTLNNSRYDSYITIYYNGDVKLTRNTGGWDGISKLDICSLMVVDFLKMRGYEFKYEIPEPLKDRYKKFERETKLKILDNNGK